jgi:signal transduction histidine kinase
MEDTGRQDMKRLIKKKEIGPRSGGACRERGLKEPQDSVRITVTDTGVGIEPDLLPHVFEPFRQADWHSAGTQGGLGLGLAIVREIVELHGGTVEVQSKGRDSGATFIVTLPTIVA